MLYHYHQSWRQFEGNTHHHHHMRLVNWNCVTDWGIIDSFEIIFIIRLHINIAGVVIRILAVGWISYSSDGTLSSADSTGIESWSMPFWIALGRSFSANAWHVSWTAVLIALSSEPGTVTLCHGALNCRTFLTAVQGPYLSLWFWPRSMTFGSESLVAFEQIYEVSLHLATIASCAYTRSWGIRTWDEPCETGRL